MFGMMFWLLTLGCGGCLQEEELPTGSGMNGGRLLFIGVDGLDPLLLRGLFRDEPENFPNLGQMVGEGFMVDLEVSSFPMLSPILWTSMTTGYDQTQHGVTGWTKGDNAATQESVMSRRFWEGASEDGRSVLQLGSLLTSPVVPLNGVNIGDSLLRAQFKKGTDSKDLESHVYPASRAEEFSELIPKVAWLEVHPLLGYQFDSVGSGTHPLGSDETNTRLFEQLWPELEPEIGVIYIKGADRVGHLADPVSETGQATAASTAYTRFSDIGPQWVGDYYIYIDQLIGRIMDKVDPTDTTVVLASDHGFEVNSEESEWVSRHRDPGILIGWGQRAYTDVDYARVHQLDLGVTLFGLSGLAPGEDAHGRMLSELFALEDVPAPLGSWILQEPLPLANEGNQTSTSTQQLRELEALGYVDPQGEERVDRQFR